MEVVVGFNALYSPGTRLLFLGENKPQSGHSISRLNWEPSEIHVSYLFFIYSVFNDAVSSPDYIASNCN
jgi:hypothetical protein